MLTLAPELCDEEDLRTLVAHGVILSAGHSDATYDEEKRAIAAGLTGFTHFFHAMSPLHHRAPGAVGAALDPDSYSGLSVGDVPLHPAIVRLAWAVKGPNRLHIGDDPTT